MTTPAAEDEFTELVDADFPRVDLVGKGANGFPRFLIAKSDAAGLLEPDFVRDLIAKAEPDTSGRERVTMPSGVTLTGSPADIAAFIHKAAQKATGPAEPDEAAAISKAAAEYDRIVKAKYSADELRSMGGKGQAYRNPDGHYSYPVKDEADLGNAIRAVGRGGADHDGIRHYLIGRAKSLGASSKIPDNWAADGSLKETSVSKTAGDTVTKDMGPDLDEGIDGMDPTVPLAAPETAAPGDPAAPGSPAWEAIDAATACKWTSILARAKVAVGMLAEREMIEAVSADPGDGDNACDLTDACCAIDFAIGVLAPFAVAEQSEADCGAAAMAVAKAMAGDLSGPLGTIEALAQVRKAGRVLSASNEAAIRGAADSLNKVLMSLPAAPVADETVTKEAAVAASSDQIAAMNAPPLVPAEGTAPAEVAKAEETAAQETAPLAAETPTEPVAKADTETPMVVYDGKGQPLGIVAPANIGPVQGAAPAAGAADMDAKPDNGDDAAADPAPAADDAPAPAADAPCPDPGDMTPQPAAEAGVPAGEDKVAKADPATTDSTITLSKDELASTIAKAITAALDARAPAEGIAKGDAAEALAVAKSLEDRLAIVENSPAAPRVFTNGAVPPPGQLRGQDRAQQGALPQIDVAKARERKQELYSADAPDQARIAKEMQQEAIDRLALMHAGH